MNELSQAQTSPLQLRWLDGNTGIGVTWADHHESTYDLTYLRTICPCAACRGAHESPPLSQAPKKKFNILSDDQAKTADAPSGVRSVQPVGNYAISFVWTDGHSEGIYSFRYLREMCPCKECAARLSAEDSET